MKVILKYLSYIFLSFLVALCMYTFIMTELFKKDFVNVFGYTYFVVATGSMSGTIEVNDIVIVKLNDTYKVDDIITYKNDGNFITHRVMNINDTQVITKGDTNNVEDEPIKKDTVVGRVIFNVSLSFLFKLIGICIIFFLFITLINFEKIFKKYIVKQDNKYELELLKDEEESKLLNYILRMIQLKNKNIKDIGIEKENILKFQFIYKVLNSLLIDDIEESIKLINNPDFKELYNYNFDEVGLSNDITNKLYDMNIYCFLKILVFACLYGDEEYFDGVYKIMKYKVKIDRYQKFIVLDRLKEKMEVENLINFMNQVVVQMPDNEIFELDKITEITKIKKSLK